METRLTHGNPIPYGPVQTCSLWTYALYWRGRSWPSTEMATYYHLQQICRLVMFSVVSVRHSIRNGSRVTIIHNALDHTKEGSSQEVPTPPPSHGTSL